MVSKRAQIISLSYWDGREKELCLFTVVVANALTTSVCEILKSQRKQSRASHACNVINWRVKYNSIFGTCDTPIEEGDGGGVREDWANKTARCACSAVPWNVFTICERSFRIMSLFGVGTTRVYRHCVMLPFGLGWCFSSFFFCCVLRVASGLCQPPCARLALHIIY